VNKGHGVAVRLSEQDWNGPNGSITERSTRLNQQLEEDRDILIQVVEKGDPTKVRETHIREWNVRKGFYDSEVKSTFCGGGGGGGEPGGTYHH